MCARGIDGYAGIMVDKGIMVLIKECLSLLSLSIQIDASCNARRTKNRRLSHSCMIIVVNRFDILSIEFISCNSVLRY